VPVNAPLRYRVVAYKYELAESFTCVLPGVWVGTPFENGGLRIVGNRLTLKQFYRWDGASGPALDTPAFMRASAKHDAWYQLIRLGVLPVSSRRDADRTLRADCLAAGMHPVRAWWVYHGVRVFGAKHCKPGTPERILTAP